MKLPKLPFSIPRIRRKRAAVAPAGSMPGTLVVNEDLPPPVLWRHVYGPEGYESEEVSAKGVAEALMPQQGKTVWVDIQGLGDNELLSQVATALELNVLTLEDIVNVHQRAKLEEFDGYLFLVFRALRLLEGGTTDNEQLSLILKPGLLVTFQERVGDGFEPVRRRLREGKGPIRKSGAPYLAYALLDAAIDNYFPVLDLYSESMDSLDEEVRENPSWEKSSAIHQMRRELRQFRRVIWPLRDVTTTLGRNELQLIPKATLPFFRSCHDHVVQVAEFVEGARERASDLADLHTTMVGEKANQVMKVLTIIATIFIPLTFLCGLYGMNFDTNISPYNMPELKSRFGYLALWGFMVTVVATMLLIFRHKGWIGRRRDG